MACLVARTGRELQRYNMGRRQVVGCIPYRYKHGVDGTESKELEFLVITSQKGNAFMFPKGGWELDESVEEAASRESLEEAGVLGNVECQLGQGATGREECTMTHTMKATCSLCLSRSNWISGQRRMYDKEFG